MLLSRRKYLGLGAGALAGSLAAAPGMACQPSPDYWRGILLTCRLDPAQPGAAGICAKVARAAERRAAVLDIAIAVIMPGDDEAEVKSKTQESVTSLSLVATVMPNELTLEANVRLHAWRQGPDARQSQRVYRRSTSLDPSPEMAVSLIVSDFFYKVRQPDRVRCPD